MPRAMLALTCPNLAGDEGDVGGLRDQQPREAIPSEARSRHLAASLAVAGDRRGGAAGQSVVELWPTGRTSPETATESDVAGTGS